MIRQTLAAASLFVLGGCDAFINGAMNDYLDRRVVSSSGVHPKLADTINLDRIPITNVIASHVEAYSTATPLTVSQSHQSLGKTSQACLDTTSTPSQPAADAAGVPAGTGSSAKAQSVAAKGPSVVETEACMNFWIQQFYGQLDNTEKKEARNRIQDRLLAASESQCVRYQAYLTQFESGVSTVTGSLTTILGGLGALFTAESTARALAGSAGITSGVGASIDSGIFKQQTIPVIMTGINMSRQESHSVIEAKQKNSITDYTLEHSLKDALIYHSKCSIVEGLKSVKDAIAKNSGDVGLAAAERVVDRVNTLRDKQDAAKLKPEDRVAVLEKIKVTTQLSTEIAAKNQPAGPPTSNSATLSAKALDVNIADKTEALKKAESALVAAHQAHMSATAAAATVKDPAPVKARAEATKKELDDLKAAGAAAADIATKQKVFDDAQKEFQKIEKTFDELKKDYEAKQSAVTKTKAEITYAETQLEKARNSYAAANTASIAFMQSKQNCLATVRNASQASLLPYGPMLFGNDWTNEAVEQQRYAVSEFLLQSDVEQLNWFKGKFNTAPCL